MQLQERAAAQPAAVVVEAGTLEGGEVAPAAVRSEDLAELRLEQTAGRLAAMAAVRLAAGRLEATGEGRWADLAVQLQDQTAARPVATAESAVAALGLVAQAVV